MPHGLLSIVARPHRHSQRLPRPDYAPVRKTHIQTQAIGLTPGIDYYPTRQAILASKVAAAGGGPAGYQANPKAEE
ncbi:hypothetical protein GCM10011375_03330 [Hymenobacter qilianensis]|uniref:Uncharacterized protein n=1 Tax=Hymenobacter qilianensis TaxID=1385715 RepID=A0ACB5PLR9_9BACT|nr:hypothetical protein GCM10011375_03330 [Hymenobacter qilianensis]